MTNGSDPNNPDDPPACTLPYDFNNNNIVDLDDVLIIQEHSIFNSAPYDPTWDIAPIPADGVVDIVYIFQVSLHIGEQCPVE